MKKILRITSILCTLTLLSSNIALANDLGVSADVTIKEDGKGITILTQNNKQITNYTATASNSRNGYKATIDTTFVDDKHSDGMTTILSLKGFIPSGKRIYRAAAKYGAMEWPSKYKVEVKNLSLNKSVKIVDSIPKNAIDTKIISNSIGYSIGGGVETSQKSLSLNANYTFSKSVSYEQPDYKTIQMSDDNELASWKTIFTETQQGYNLSSWNIMYGNQLFMKTRYRGDYETNFLDDSELSTLIAGGFSPNMGLVLTAPNGTKNSVIEVTLSKVLDTYFMRWADTNWFGFNYGNDNELKQTFKFRINWKDHKIKEID